METYDVIRVLARSGNPDEMDERTAEVERYIYGRYFFLGRKPNETISHRPMHDLFFLVEAHYTEAIIARLASGLFSARLADERERFNFGFYEGDEFEEPQSPTTPTARRRV